MPGQGNAREAGAGLESPPIPAYQQANPAAGLLPQSPTLASAAACRAATSEASKFSIASLNSR